MDKPKFQILKEIISRWDIDVNKGTVSTCKGDKHYVNKAGYLVIGTTYNGKFKLFLVHQIILCKAGYDLTGLTVDHINGNKKDNRLCNLEVVSARENTLRAVCTGTNNRIRKARNENSGKTKLTNVDVAYIKYCLNTGAKGVMELADMFKVAHSRISEIKTGKTWREIKALEEVV